MLMLTDSWLRTRRHIVYDNGVDESLTVFPLDNSVCETRA